MKKTAIKRHVGRPRKPTPYVEHRGGAREGAGRKAYLDPSERKVTISLRISPENKERSKVLREKGINLSAEFEKIIEKYAKVLM